MKRILSVLLCLCMLLPMTVMLSTATVTATEAAQSEAIVSTDKSVYAPGEPIRITAKYTVKDCWLGILPADENGNPIVSKGTIYWKYVPEAGMTNAPLEKTDNPIDTTNAKNATALAELMGVTVAEMMTLPCGDYFIAYIESGKGIGSVASSNPELIHYVPITISQFAVEKTSFLFGESILVDIQNLQTPTGYIGLSHVKDDGTPGQNLYYAYVNSGNINTTIDLKKDGTVYGADKEKYGRLPAGRYLLYYVPTNSGGVTSRDRRSEVYIDIVGATVEKTEFLYGEPIMVKGYGSGKDWIGISTHDASTESGYWSNGSIRWRYITHDTGRDVDRGYGVGVAFDLREAKLAGAASARADLPVGDYVIFVGLDDCYASDVSKYTEIPITITALAPSAPKSITYDLDDARTGLAGGTLTVTFAEADMAAAKKPTKVELYWADENGNELEGYHRIGSRKITGAVTEIEMTASMVIPENAKKLMVRAYNGAGSAEVASVDLPATRSYRKTGEKVTSFQIVSDMHIGRTNNDGAGVNMSDKHAAQLFSDVMTLDPDSVGIFVAGDAADHGLESEYAHLFDLWAEANADGLRAKLYIGVGNHEMMGGSGHNYVGAYADQTNRFLSFANLSLEASEKTDKPYYYVSRGGQHFIFLSTEYSGTHAYLSDAQLAWLRETLASVASDGAPVFILLHQPMYNTIAGGLASADDSLRQGWHGVIAGDANFEAWKNLCAEKGKGTSDHGLMYGQYEEPLRAILRDYPSAMMFSGHSHWIMESLGNIHEASDTLPNYLFNTASVSYLWTDNDDLHGGSDPGEGSQGYFVTVYENCIELRGRDILNGKWIPNAYYRVWLDCAHETDLPCDTTCKWCGEPIENATACDGEHACSITCIYCGKETVKDTVPCDGEHACSTTCIHCGKETVKDAVPCVGKLECSDRCRYCDGVITPVKNHESEHPCSDLCRYCNEKVVTPSAEHKGKFDCSDSCDACGTAITPVKVHESEHACSDLCRYCNEKVVTPSAEHKGKFECSETCDTCGTQIPAEKNHESVGSCSATCKYCGEDVVDANAAHKGEFECSTSCKICGTQIPAEKNHESVGSCSATCKYCGEEVIDTDTLHEGEFECSNTCKTCGETITPVKNHEGAFPCTEICKLCGEKAVTPSTAHKGEFVCSDTCKTCGEAITPEADHDFENDCDPDCGVCGLTREVPDHVYGEWKDFSYDSHKRVCACGDEQSAPHVWGEGVVKVEPSADKDGETHFTCTDCGVLKILFTAADPSVTTAPETTAPDTEPGTTEPDTTAPETTEPTTTEPSTTETDPSTEPTPDTDPDTEPTPETKPAPDTETPPETSGDDEKKGCGSVIGGSAAMLAVALALSAALSLKKRDEESSLRIP